jgi:hypothetical protein
VAFLAAAAGPFLPAERCGDGCDDGCDRLVLAAGDLRAGDLRAGAARSAPAATCFHWMEAKFSVHSPCVRLGLGSG